MPSTTFFLNRRLYHSNEYPLTYSIYLQNIQRRRSSYFQRIIILLALLLLTLLFFPSKFYGITLLPSMKKCTFFSIAIFDSCLLHGFPYFLLLIINYFLSYFISYCINEIRITIFKKYGIFYSLQLQKAAENELLLLFCNGTVNAHLLRLDSLIRKKVHFFLKIGIIEGANNELFLIRIAVKECRIDDNKTRPFMIFRVSSIRWISFEGVYIIKNGIEKCLKWPVIKLSKNAEEIEEEQRQYAEWLHEELMEISEEYKKRFEQYLHKNKHQYSVTSGQLSHTVKDIFIRLINEEKRIRKARLRRSSSITQWKDEFSLEDRIIACFRLQEETRSKFVDENTKIQDDKCTICVNRLFTGEKITTWPCKSSHRFHYVCMLKWLQTNDSCPLCRKSFCLQEYIESSPTEDEQLSSSNVTTLLEIDISRWYNLPPTNDSRYIHRTDDSSRHILRTDDSRRHILRTDDSRRHILRTDDSSRHALCVATLLHLIADNKEESKGK